MVSSGLQLLSSLSGDGGFAVHRKLAPQSSREEGKLRASSSSLPLPSPLPRRGFA